MERLVIRQRMKSRAVTTADLARELGVSIHHVRNVLCGSQSSRKLLKRIDGFLDLPTDPGFGHVGGGPAGKSTGEGNLLIMPKTFAEGLDLALSASFDTPATNGSERGRSRK